MEEEKDNSKIIANFLKKQSKLLNKVEKMLTLFPSDNGKEHFTHAVLNEIKFDIEDLLN